MYGALQHAVEYSAATMIVQFSTRIFMSQSVHSLKPFALPLRSTKSLCDCDLKWMEILSILGQDILVTLLLSDALIFRTLVLFGRIGPSR